MIGYSFCLNEKHIEQSLDEALEWHDTVAGFATDREREAYKAGFLQGARDQRSLFKLHAGLKLAD